MDSDYIVQPAFNTFCPSYHTELKNSTPMLLLINKYGYIDDDTPAFYICPLCSRIYEIGKGECKRE